MRVFPDVVTEMMLLPDRDIGGLARLAGGAGDQCYFYHLQPVIMGEHQMPIRFILLGILLIMASSANAAERFLLNLELTQGKNRIEMGRTFVSKKSHTWSKGLKRSYLKVYCRQQESGKTQKLYSTEDHFAGLRVTHQLAGDNVKLIVVQNIVQPRLVEIRALAKNECKDLSPIVTTISETYMIPAKDGIDEVRPFGENMTFRATLRSAGWNR